MDRVTIDQVIAKINLQLHLSKESETEILAEIRAHLEDAVADAIAKGIDEQAALLKAAEQFGAEETGAELQVVHSNQESIDAILATALPVVFTLILRWLSFAPDGSALAWPQLLVRPGFYLVAIISFIIPLLWFRRWRFVLWGWGVFWLFTLVFIFYPNVHGW